MISYWTCGKQATIKRLYLVPSNLLIVNEYFYSPVILSQLIIVKLWVRPCYYTYRKPTSKFL